MAASSSSSSGEQQYSLRWNDFHSSILSSFRHLRDEEDFVDVTLACDSSSFTAHKVVLSACSPYFRRLLKANPCQHPIVILRDVASSDMESLLRFMYHGEVHVGQEQLAAFLKTAQMLQVRGLADVNSGAATAKIPPPPSSSGNNGSAPTTPRNPWQDNGRGDLNESGLSPPPDKRPRSYSPPLGNHIEPKTDLQESLLGQALEGGPTIHTTPTNNVQAQSTGEDSNSISDNEEDMSNNDSILNSVKTEPSDILNDSMEHHRSTFPAALLGLQGLMPGPSGIHAANQDPNYVARRGLDMMRVRATDPRPCPKCGKIYRSAHTLRTHLEDKHTICPGYRCVLCGTVAKSRNSLHSHMSRQHRGISTKDLPVLPMPSPFDPELASRLLAKAGVKVSPAELRARASPTGPRRGDMRLELPRGAPSEAGSSVCGGDDPEDLTLPLSLRYGSPTPNNNTVITKVTASSNNTAASNNKSSTATAIAAKSLDTMHGNREPNTAPLHPPGHLHPGHHNASATGSAILDTYLQFIAENSGLTTMGLSPEQAAAVAAAHAAKMAHMSAMDKLGGRGLEEYPMIGRDEGRGPGVVHEDRQDLSQDRHPTIMDEAESSAAEEDDFSENEEPEVVKAD
ncbi:protein abrupt-like isoform X1 [Vespula pensylvanica]|nr:protein abrupt-like isoform X1 [Vespula pensylvanica]XP_043682056.1 protein abrupt-like isoform X1 [Vespula pensylvanica]XP_043682057.1 protein abrupt-like isoform X1 [Vespula pensylvanica]XP_043682058.1 protein abrupt-like isoform X1 [Vespula pensylvanica]XP_043682059.1 protein abrupt-like isoform X1 [Vespula pensylvanica]XP_050865933.1 protein abrupt-like isoform X1 [Vespula vulgaris]XP_050865934.1 protein abrupt-like isoform X1 [Vespula vulgaris]XP_050865935.1 protein abrupt-like isofo